jgi:hypothetical protein
MDSPKADCELLMRTIIPFAKKMLKEHGEFSPYGGVLLPDKKIVDVAARERGQHYPKPTVLIGILEDGFKKRASGNEIIACGIVFDGRIVPPGESHKWDAIQINLEHVDGYSAEVFFPYRKNHDAIEYGNIFSQRGEAKIFRAN